MAPGPTAFAFVRKGNLVAALALWLFGVLLALLVAAATAATLIALGLSAALATPWLNCLTPPGDRLDLQDRQVRLRQSPSACAGHRRPDHPGRGCPA